MCIFYSLVNDYTCLVTAIQFQLNLSTPLSLNTKYTKTNTFVLKRKFSEKSKKTQGINMLS